MNFKQIKEKYGLLNDKKKLLVFFLIQWLYWAFAGWVFQKVWPDELPWTFLNFIFKSLWMASWMTLIFKWKKIKEIFSNKRNDARRRF